MEQSKLGVHVTVSADDNLVSSTWANRYSSMRQGRTAKLMTGHPPEIRRLAGVRLSNELR
jgi:hypothetical protein